MKILAIWHYPLIVWTKFNNILGSTNFFDLKEVQKGFKFTRKPNDQPYTTLLLHQTNYFNVTLN